MKIAQSVRMGAWLLIGLNLLMALGSIWIFMRMAPAIEVIIDRNERSLQACEAMLSSLALMRAGNGNKDLKTKFMNALRKAQNNVTEKEEPIALASINAHALNAFTGDKTALLKTVAGIDLLGKINREAMIAADIRARQFGYAGAWGVVFMATCVFFAGMVFKRSLSKALVKPLEEIHSVMSAQRHGDTMRRCICPDLTKDVKSLFDGINEFIDSYHSRFS